MNINSRLSTLCALGLSALAVGCDGGTAQDGTPVNTQHGGAMPNVNLPGYEYRPSGTGINNNAGSAGTTDLTVDYNLALRSAAIKLTGDLPTLAEITTAAEGIFEIQSMHNGRLDYAWTCEQWARRLRAHREEASRLVGPDVVARYERYLKLSAIGFRMGKLCLLRIVLHPFRGSYFGDRGGPAR